MNATNLLVLVLVVVLVLALLPPVGGHLLTYGYAPSGLLTVVLIILVVLLLTGRL